MTEKTRPTITLVYAGYRFTSGDKLAEAYYLVDGDELRDNDIKLFPKSKRRDKMGGSVGMMYEVETTDPKTAESIYTATAKFVGRWHNKQQVVDWEAKSRSSRDEFDAYMARYKETRFNQVKHDMIRIRAAYQKLPNAHRRFFLAQLVDFLHTGE